MNIKKKYIYIIILVIGLIVCSRCNLVLCLDHHNHYSMTDRAVLAAALWVIWIGIGIYLYWFPSKGIYPNSIMLAVLEAISCLGLVMESMTGLLYFSFASPILPTYLLISPSSKLGNILMVVLAFCFIPYFYFCFRAGEKRKER